MQRIKSGDTVEIITGKDLGERGKVMRVIPKKERLVVEGLNIATKHQKARQQGTQQIPAQIVQFPAPLHLSNVMLVCPSCSKRVRVGVRTTEAGRKVRYCKKCDENIE